MAERVLDSVDDVGGTWVKGSVDKAGTLFARLAEDDIARKFGQTDDDKYLLYDSLSRR